MSFRSVDFIQDNTLQWRDFWGLKMQVLQNPNFPRWGAYRPSSWWVVRRRPRFKGALSLVILAMASPCFTDSSIIVIIIIINISDGCERRSGSEYDCLLPRLPACHRSYISRLSLTGQLHGCTSVVHYNSSQAIFSMNYWLWLSWYYWKSLFTANARQQNKKKKSEHHLTRTQT